MNKIKAQLRAFFLIGHNFNALEDSLTIEYYIECSLSKKVFNKTFYTHCSMIMHVDATSMPQCKKNHITDRPEFQP